MKRVNNSYCKQPKAYVPNQAEQSSNVALLMGYIYLPTPLHKQDVTQGQFLGGVGLV